ncbi:pyridoxal phosphate-dependent aminotransferase [Mobilitalea sibirica]|uniref:cysteine-S-conjugate beta-lyase n=1 Tax=Mobilitalea sibirica TaxID=1462919 RepID=A0A8J7H1Y4_9FIRM|nr:MalY/PatB family protein [Mobilitalea sibirica]MBH1940619.1 pyridoxal phosphate-dependent aminotransferase [Mobilitalea sibirica]
MSLSHFDEIINRKGTNSIKYDFAVQRGKPEDLLPLWVADMDFRTPPEVTRELKKAVDHGIYGYSESKEEYFAAIQGWYQKRFDFEIQKEWLVKTPGVVFAIAMAIRAFTKEGDAVLIQRPVYYPFSETILANNRKLVNNPLVYEDGSYRIDFDDFETKITKNNVKLFLLCSPHNPVGRVWTREELIRLGDICIRHNVMVISDEIHADFIYKGYHHSIFGKLKDEFLQNSILCTAPSKTFNLAGLQVSNILIANKDIRDKFKNEIRASGYSQLNTMGLIACQTAYESGAEWLDDLLGYLEENLEFTRNFLKEHLPQIKLVEPQGTYLLWLDFSTLNLSEKALEDLIVRRAKLWLDHGTMFGSEGRGFQRINMACPREILKKALIQLEKAINTL